MSITVCYNDACEIIFLDNLIPANIYPLKVSNRNTRKRCEICSKLTIKTPEQRPLKWHTYFNLQCLVRYAGEIQVLKQGFKNKFKYINFFLLFVNI